MPINHISDLESWVKDAEDPVQFTEALFMIQKTDKHVYEPLKNYDYIKKYLRDESDLKVSLKSRQTGFSYGDVLDALHKAVMKKNYEKIYISVKEENAQYLIRKATELVDNCQPGWEIPLKRRQAGFIQLESTKSIIRSLASSGAGGRGFNADVTLDELAFMPEEKAIMDSIMQATVRKGWRVSMISTPFGESGEYYEAVKATGWDTESIWKHPSQLKQFEKELQKVIDNNTSKYSLHAVPWFMCPDLHEERARARARTEDIFEQEYCLAFLDEAKAILPFNVIKKNIDLNLENYDWRTAYKTGYPRYMGIDPAEGYNETAIVVAEWIKKTWRIIYTWNKKSRKSEYLPIIKRLYYSFKPEITFVDRTGMGGPITDDIQNMIPGTVNGIFLSNSEKERIVYNLVSHFDSGNIMIPQNETLINQLHTLRGTKLPSGAIRFTGKSFGRDDDLVWALGLAIYPSADSENFGEQDIEDFKWDGKYVKESFVDNPFEFDEDEFDEFEDQGYTKLY